jgi:hypothetical protein
MALAYFPYFEKINLGSRDYFAVCVCLCIPLSLLGNGSVKVSLSLLGNGSVKIPLSLLDDGSVKISLSLLGNGSVKNVTAITNTQATIEEMLYSSFSM